MPFHPFVDKLADCRVVNIPAGLDADQRSRFVAKIAAAVRQQAQLAQRSSGVLRVTGEVGEAGDRLLIPHEPASPADPQAVINADERPDIATLWWLTAATGGALQTATAEKVLHGGVQLGALFLDEAGRPKLGDFGIAPVFEKVCGLEARRLVHCDAAVSAGERGRTLSGAWSLLGEDDAREHGWITLYFAHELLEGEMRLNPKATLFALGVLLYLCATGEHPYGASLSDPSLNLYFHLEPYSLAEERPDWAEVFERQRTGVARSADQAVIAWSELMLRFLASDPSERLVAPDEAEQLLQAHASPEWAQASADIDAANGLLERGDAEASVEKLRPWCGNEALPALWRQRLGAWVDRIETQKDSIRGRKSREHQIAAGHEALESLDLDRARQAASGVRDDPDAEDDLRAAADELIGLCDEQRRFIESGADTLAAAYLEAAQDAMQRGELEEARQVLHGVMQDPGMSGARAAQARQLVGEVELVAERIERQTVEFDAATQEDSEGDYGAAEQRLTALLAEEGLGDQLTARASTLLAAVQQKQVRRAEQAEALRQAEAAWQDADSAAMDAQLARVPPDVDDPEIRPHRQRLAARCARLRSAGEQRREAERLLAAGQPAEAVAMAARVAAVEDLPDGFVAGLRELMARGQEAVEQQRQAALEKARSVLVLAQERYDDADTAACRELLADNALTATEVSAEPGQQAVRLSEACDRLDAALGRLDQARQHLVHERFDAAGESLDEIATAGLPDKFTDQAGELRTDIAHAREEFARRQQEALGRGMADARAALDADRVKEAKAGLRAVEGSEFLTDELRAGVAELKAAIKARKPAKRNVGPLAAAAVFVVVVAGGAWYLASMPARQEPVEEPASVPVVATPAEPGPDQVEPATPAARDETADDVPPVADETVTPPVDEAVVSVEPEPEPEPVPAEVVVEPPAPEPVTPPEIVEPPPVPTFDEAAEEFLQALGTLLPKGCGAPGWRGEPAKGLSLAVAWHEHDLLPYAGLSFDGRTGMFSETPDEVVAWFGRQIGVWRVLDAPEGTVVRLDERYDAALVLVPSAGSRLGAVSEEPRRAEVVVRARLRTDPRPAEQFELSGGLSGGTLTADEAGRTAFAAYLRGLQTERLGATAEDVAARFELPAGLRIELPPDFAGADECELVVRYGDVAVARFAARWSPAELKYEVDDRVARERVVAGVGRLVQTEGVRQALRADWSSVSPQLAVKEPHVGARYYEGCTLLELTPLAGSPDTPFQVPIRATVGVDGAPAEEHFEVALRAAVVDGRFSWDVSDLSEARRQVATALAGLASSPPFRQRRQREAVSQLAGELGLEVDGLTPRPDGDVLALEVTAGGRTTRYAWSWDPSRLCYGERRAQAPPGIDEQLAALAQSPVVDAADFVPALRAVTARKAASYGADAYRVGPELAASSADPRATLAEVSRALQTLIAPDPAADPFPVVFVEHYVGPQDVYALSWRAVTDEQDRIVGVTDISVWRVMSTAELQPAGEPAAFGRRYSTDVDLGERLLGRALGAAGQAVAASQHGSFGVVIAPQDRLWLTRWEQVRLEPRALRGLANRGAPDVGTFNFLRQVIKPHTPGRGEPQWRRAGIWCVPTLGGAWYGETADTMLALGSLIAGKPELNLRFRSRGADQVFFAYVEDLTRTGDFGWRTYVGTVRRGEIGYTFWNRGWDERGWLPTPYVSFSLLRVLEP